MFSTVLYLSCGAAILASMFLIILTLKRSKTASYRRLYIQCVARLDMVSVVLNQMKDLAVHVKDDKALERYEKTLATMETLLTALIQVPTTPTGKELVNSLEPMLSMLEKETNASVMEFKKILKGPGPMGQVLEKLQRDSKPPVRGCYFCSSPYSPRTFKRVQIRMGEQSLKVYGCGDCRSKLESRGIIDVLFFKAAGKKVHWSDTESYEPKKDFWIVHKLSPKYEKPKLELLPNDPDND